MILDIVGLQISVPEFILTIISFFLFMFLLNKILLKPVLSFMDARKARIDAGLAEGKNAEAALEENSHIIGKNTYVMTLQNGAGHEDILAKFKDGLLTMDVPKAEKKPKVETPKYIAIEG